jgi:predicted GNAT family N-acyltransferase/CTP:molybdopterin cytidylyltransferase MocA
MSRLGVVAAAGDSRRFGMAKSLLVRSDGSTQVRAWAEELLRCCDHVVVTTPADHATTAIIRTELSGLRVIICTNDNDPHLWGSVQSARRLHPTATSVLVAPVDVPMIAGVSAALHAAFQLDQDDVVVPTSATQPGHPVLLSSSWLARPDVTPAAATSGIEGALSRTSARQRLVAIDNAKVLHNHNHRSACPVHVELLVGGAMLRASHAVRRRVFMEEQGVSEADELDDQDGEARHWLAIQDEWVVGTARWLWLDHNDRTAKVQRVAVLAPWRRSGVGAQLMAAIEHDAKQQGAKRLVLGAQLSAVSFYQRLGYRPEGEVFLDANIEHRTMHKDA